VKVPGLRMIESLLTSAGRQIMGAARDAGGIAVLLFEVVRALIPPRLDGRELVRNLYKMGNRSVPIVVLTALFVGALMVVQFAAFVKQFGAHGLVGWGTGYAVLREVGPILIALMFSGRVGANNTAELGTMTVTEQIDGLLTLAIDPIRYLIVPRVVAMMVTLVALTMLGDAVAITGSALMSQALLGIDPRTVWYSLVDNLGPADFLHGVAKSGVFGLAIALSSCYYGITVKGGAVGVGRAVNDAVVSAAVSICLLDFFMTYLTS
jgi:phospholipid/cholesterol/gamma-HCH transport system permease protein